MLNVDALCWLSCFVGDDPSKGFRVMCDVAIAFVPLLRGCRSSQFKSALDIWRGKDEANFRSILVAFQSKKKMTTAILTMPLQFSTWLASVVGVHSLLWLQK
uniref:Uncharacterized protein n=1 Tax=Entomoneis paludosa TaxID=265537 RepID=A0A7S2YQ77_9STRA